MKYGFLPALILAVSATLGALPAGSAAPVTVIRAGALIDGTSATPRRDQAIVVANHRIERGASRS